MTAYAKGRNDPHRPKTLEHVSTASVAHAVLVPIDLRDRVARLVEVGAWRGLGAANSSRSSIYQGVEVWTRHNSDVLPLLNNQGEGHQ